MSKRTTRNVFANIIFQGLTFVLSIVSNLVLARLLTPEDFGLVASVVLLTAFLNIFNSGGLAQATISEENINHRKISAVFCINVIIGLCLALICLVASPFVADFFNDARIQPIIWLFSLSVIATSLSIQYRGLLLRNFHYLKLNIIDVSSLFVGISLSIGLAYLGMGYWSIVIGTTLTATVKPLGYFLITKWVPSVVFRGAGTRGMLKFGADVIGFQLINYFSRNLDNILVGRVLGVAALGQYSFAYRLAVAPIQQISGPINNALLPALSRLRDKPLVYELLYTKYTRLISIFVVLPIASASIFGSDLLVYLAGVQWQSAGDAFEWLALACCMQPLANLTGIVFMSTRRTRQQLYWSLFVSPFVFLTFFLFVGYGIEMLAFGYFILNLLFTPICFIWAFIGTPICLKKYLLRVSPVYACIILLSWYKLTLSTF